MVKFSKSGLQEKVPEGSNFIFVDTRISLNHRVGLVDRSLHAKKQINPFIPFDTTPTCGRQTDRQTDTDTIVSALA